MEAAKMESKSKSGLFMNIIFPLLTPTIIIVLLLRLAEAIKLFDIPYALTGGGPGVATQSMSFLAFRTGLRYFDLGYASAISYCLLIVVMIIVTLFFRSIEGKLCIKTGELGFNRNQYVFRYTLSWLC